MTLKAIEASQASLEWRYVDRLVKRSDVGGYVIQVTINQGSVIPEYLYTLSHCGFEMLSAAVIRDDRNGQAEVNEYCMSVAVEHWSLRSLRAEAYAAVGGGMVAKYGINAISLLNRESLQAVIRKPRLLEQYKNNNDFLPSSIQGNEAGVVPDGDEQCGDEVTA